MRACIEENILNVIALLQHGHSTYKCQNCWAPLNLHALGYVDIVFLQEEDAQEASPVLNDEHV